jgi:Ca2+-binding EF-hand superfamily protein
MGTCIVTALRNAFGADCAMINAGNIRGNTEYPTDLKNFTYSNLQTEMPFESVVFDLQLPGKVINETVSFTRAWSLQEPPVEKGCYMQLDESMTWDRETNTVTHINKEPLDPDRMYECVVLWQVAMEGIDQVTPLHDYCKAHFADNLFPHDADVGRPAKQVLVDYFGRSVWWHVIEDAGGFSGLDANKDGRISEQELREAVHKAPALEGDLGDIVIQNIMAMADIDHDHYICKGELLSVSFLSMDFFQAADVDNDRMLTKEEVYAEFQKLLGEEYDQALADKTFEQIDKDGDGRLSLAEVKKRGKELQKQLKV